MGAVKLNAPVRTHTGEVTTIADLADAGRITFRVVERLHSPRSALGYRVAYFADLTERTEDGDGRFGWEISKAAYLSRTGQSVVIERLPDPRAVKVGARVVMVDGDGREVERTVTAAEVRRTELAARLQSKTTGLFQFARDGGGWSARRIVRVLP